MELTEVSTFIADCRLIVEAAQDEERLMDVDFWTQLRREFEGLQKENELLKNHLLNAARGGLVALCCIILPHVRSLSFSFMNSPPNPQQIVEEVLE
jgi:hypothetical protein